eukprot:4418131-Alexandrium_andersonii.AAC.1
MDPPPLREFLLILVVAIPAAVGYSRGCGPAISWNMRNLWRQSKLELLGPETASILVPEALE